MLISDRNSASTDSTLTPSSAMTNPQYLLKYHTDKEFVDFLIRCFTVRPKRVFSYFRKNSYLVKYNKKIGSVEILFCLYSFILCGSLENDPLSPPEGEAAQGEHPLDPLFFLGYISTLSGVIAIGGMPERRGRKHEKLEPPRAIICFYEDFYKAKKLVNYKKKNMSSNQSFAYPVFSLRFFSRSHRRKRSISA